MMLCTIYRSLRKDETYLYLKKGGAFSDLPETLRERFGEPVFVMHLPIGPDTRLARVDAKDLLDALEDPGFYLQLPPETPTELEIARRLGTPAPDS
jgi:uncharacterized protein YcgL (UPF0745 family)